MRQIDHGINVFGIRADCVDFNHIGGASRGLSTGTGYSAFLCVTKEHF